ncbi:1,2-phenylacetyl-CoA epoxidase subunit PaaE [Blastococcus sp. Marseille-P5729]|uniref:1,2-phenylacetyl-CoA epoxidase subunit PaaE n=1 Tax=Blastococcus sp. Marseille-P5729 TaxID=2086582 RepID=UPI000D107161|nr:1,2-phenylacetyl-CoA epoxidase subunit PaaE [Blastococcus sp. Marseille-P5729]
MTATTPAPAHTTFHPLTVAVIDRLTDDSVAVTFDVPEDLVEEFVFRPGQHLTLRRRQDDADLRRSYSICASPASRRLRVAIKAVEDGVFSTYAINALVVGDIIDVLPPAGNFTTRVDPAQAKHYVMLAAGSGITPILSLVTTILQTEPRSQVTLVYGNQRTSTIMFLEELADLKDLYPDRFQLINVLSREAQVVEMFNGRIDAEKLGALTDQLIPLGEIDEWFICGPFEMVIGSRDFLASKGIDPKKVHFELFHVEDKPRERKKRSEASTINPEDLSNVTMILGGRQASFDLEKDTISILDAALEVRGDVPFACTGGGCGTCRCKITEGEGEMEVNWALEPDEAANGIRLACQSRPLTEKVTVDFDI